MNEAQVQELQVAFRGPIAGERVQYLLHLKLFLQDAQEQGIAFEETVRVVTAEMNILARSKLDVIGAPGLKLREFTAISGLISSLPRRPLHDSEAVFLQDAVGFLDFALRNGFTFLSAIEPLGHDFIEIERHGYNLQDSIQAGFTGLKVSGYRDIDSKAFSDEDVDEFS